MKKLFRLSMIALVLAGLGYVAWGWWGVAPTARIEMESDRPGIGPRTEIRIAVAVPRRGIEALEVDLRQGEESWRVGQAEYGPDTLSQELTVEVGRETVQGLEPGEATVEVTAHRRGTWLRTPPPTVERMDLPVRFTPPQVGVTSTLNYATQGGSGVVVYRVGERAVRDGVEVGEWWFPGYPLPGGEASQRFALFGVPWSVGEGTALRLVVEDELGNRAETPFLERFFPRPPKQSEIRLSDPFLSKVVPEILDRTPQLGDRGSLLQSYLAINGELREQNRRRLREIAGDTRETFLWSRPFLQMPNTQVMSSFADHRTYRYEGKDVDRQVHLGFDLASTRHAPVPAANRGVVLVAEYFGIYGNAVVLDHGYGLMTLYAHLSVLDVTPGQQVERGQALGRSGETGLAGGDHLHFTTLLHGLPVTPTEWWDGDWIAKRIARKLGPALIFEQ